MEGISHRVYSGPARAPHRSLLRALGIGRDDADRPLIGVCNSYNELIPGHMHLNTIAQQVKYGVYQGGGIPLEFNVIGVCDGLAMNHEGMNYSLVSREVIADSVEIMAKAHGVDGLVLIPNCDKIVPGMVMGAARVDIPVVLVSGGPMLAGDYQGRKVSLSQIFEGLGKYFKGEITDRGPVRPRRRGVPDLRIMRRPVHRQLHGLRHGDPGADPARRRHHPGAVLRPTHSGPGYGRGGVEVVAQGLDRAPLHHQGQPPQRPDRGRGSRLLHQHGAAPAGHRQRSRRRPRASRPSTRSPTARPTWSSWRRRAPSTWKTCTGRAASRRCSTG